MSIAGTGHLVGFSFSLTDIHFSACINFRFLLHYFLRYVLHTLNPFSLLPCDVL